MSMQVRYIGNGPYNYSYCIAMCLAAAGAEPELIDPTLIECLTTMPFGCMYAQVDPNLPGVFLPTAPNLDPHGGIDLALKSLGWSCSTWHAEARHTPEEAMSTLKTAVDKFGFALVGPVDMGFLTYLPDCTGTPGSDHYLVVTGINSEEVRVHDPSGFPLALISYSDFFVAWLAEGITYKRGPCTMRTAFRVNEPVMRRTAISRSLPRIRAKLMENPNGSKYFGESGPTVFASGDALRLLAKDIRNGIDQVASTYLLKFAFPLATKRCVDASAFLREAVKVRGAANMARHAELYAVAGSRGVHGIWSDAADAIDLCAKCEDELFASTA